ncbi:aldehyde dehydrogenase family 16 member A1 [Erythrolamprus reginae]|uniref:aldehyde dehydrogenase family 16 member A1 n=1 Tax=Erythrolamprus reginae TaxID=121349 RepID=UPI00396C9EDB
MSSPSPSSFLGPRSTDRAKVPRTRAATWSHRETLDFLALWGEESIQTQLNRCHRNADVYQWISERMAEKGYFRDEDQCRTKGKDLKKSYKQAKLQDGVARQRCRFFHELDAILGGGGNGSRGMDGGPWCQVVVKEESDPELDPDPQPQEEEYAWTQASDTDGSDLEPPGESAGAGAAVYPSSSSQAAARPLLYAEPSILHPRGAGIVIKEENTPPQEEADPHGGGRGADEDYLYHASEHSPGEIRRRSRMVEEPLLQLAIPGHLDTPWRTGVKRKAFSRPRSRLSRREKLAQLRNRRKRPWDDKFDELVRDIRTHFRESEQLFQGLWEEEKAQREKDRQLWAAEMAGIQQMWTKSLKEKEAREEDKGTDGPGHVKEENRNRDACKDSEEGSCKEGRLQEPPLLKSWLDSHGRNLGHFINGKWLKPDGRETCTIKNPTTVETLGTTIQGKKEDLDKAVQAAKTAYESWSLLPGHVRARHLYNIARTIQKHQRLLSVLDSLDSGNLIRESQEADLPLVVRHFYHYAGWAQLMEEQMSNWKPLGVVAILIPQSFPLLTLTWKLCSALAMGNTAIVMPSMPTAALFLAEICTQAGLPPGVFNVLIGDLGLKEVLAHDPGIDKVAFAGTAKVARCLRQSTAGSGKKLCLQLGEKLPFIVFDSADLDSAADAVVDAIWLNRGQVHSAGAQLFIQESISNEFIQCLKHRMGRLRLGDSMDKNTDVGPLINNKQQNFIESLLEEAQAEGAQIFQTSASRPSKELFYPPTLITGVFPTSRCFKAKAFLDCQSLQVGTVWINSHNMLDAAAAFGGYKESGHGQNGGKEALYEYVRPIWETQPRIGCMNMNFETFATSPKTDLPAPCSTVPELKADIPRLDQTYKLYYGGSQKRPDSLSSRTIVDHAEKPVAVVADGNVKDILNAVEAAHKAAPGWAKKTTHARAQILYYLAENLELRRAEIASKLESLMGIEKEEALMEVDTSVRRLFYWAAYADKYGGVVQETTLYGACIHFREPLGVVGIACPDKHPLLSFVSLFGAAITRGNCVVIIPSERYPLPALDFIQVLETSDVPAGVVNVISGSRDYLSRSLAEHHDVQAMWYFGSKEGSGLVEWASAGNLKRTWVNYGVDTRCWTDPEAGSGEEFLYQATQSKSVWMPMGDIFPN